MSKSIYTIGGDYFVAESEEDVLDMCVMWDEGDRPYKLDDDTPLTILFIEVEQNGVRIPTGSKMEQKANHAMTVTATAAAWAAANDSCQLCSCE